MLVLMNGGAADAKFTLPKLASEGVWSRVLDTVGGEPGPVDKRSIRLHGRSVVLLRFGIDRRYAPVQNPAEVNQAAVSPDVAEARAVGEAAAIDES
jgi:hypothetical protein